MKMKKVLPVVLGVLCVILAATLILTTMFSEQDENVICAGVSINGIDVGGMTMEEARAAVDAYILDMQSKSVTVKIDEELVTTTLGELGYSLSENEGLETAMELGKSGNFLNRYREQKELEENGAVISMEFLLDEDALRKFVETECTQFDIEPENAGLSRENGVFVVTEHKMGRKLSVEDTVEQIKEYLTNGNFTTGEAIQTEAVVKDAEPEYTTENASLCKDVLGKFSTSYTTSSASRSGNIANGARLINGAVLWPGETFSAGGAMNPITAENGYYMAGAYENGQVVDSIGGGVCQVSTTLYNAALLAELEIVERSNHSMIVGYVEPSMDAAIAGTYKDLKLKNNTDAPIYIEAVTSGKVITFTIYGHETRAAGRTIKYESEVLQVLEPGADKVTEDPTQPTTYRKVTQSAHKGYKAQLWKIVYENGVEVSREQVNYSSYAASPAYVTVGTKEEEPDENEETDKDKEDKENKDNKKDDSKDNKKDNKKDDKKDSDKKEEPASGDEKEDKDSGKSEGSEGSPEGSESEEDAVG